MTLFFGVLSWLQVFLLPGFAVLAWFRNIPTSTRWIAAFSLSFTLSYVIVISLATLGCYNRPTLLALMGVEVASISAAFLLSPRSKKTVCLKLREFSAIEVILLGLALIQFSHYLSSWFRDLGGIFTEHDAVVGWNRFAMEWARSEVARGFPQGINYYPMGLPGAYSVTYILLGTFSIQMFSKAMPGILFLFAMGTLIHTGWRERSWAMRCFLTVYLFGTIQAKFLQSHWTSGYADIPVTCWSAIVFCLLLRCDLSSTEKERRSTFVLALVAAFSGAMTKQGGLLTLFSVVVFGCLRIGLPSALRLSLPSVVVAGAYYGWLVLRVKVFKVDWANAGLLIQSAGSSIFDRWHHAWKMMRLFARPNELLGLAVCQIGACLALVRQRPWWAWVAIHGLGYSLIWASTFSYDIRNFAPALFALSLACSIFLIELTRFSWQEWWLLFLKKTSGNPWLSGAVPGKAAKTAGAILLAAVAFKTAHLSSDAANRETDLRMALGNGHLNQTVRRALSDTGAVRLFTNLEKANYLFLGITPVTLIECPRDFYKIGQDSGSDPFPVLYAFDLSRCDPRGSMANLVIPPSCKTLGSDDKLIRILCQSAR